MINDYTMKRISSHQEFRQGVGQLQTNNLPIHVAPHLTKVVFRAKMGIGDVCLFTIVVESLMKMFPDQFAVDVTGKFTQEIFRNNPHITKLVHSEASHIDFEHKDKYLMDKGSITHQEAVCRYVSEKLKIDLKPQFNRPIFYLTPEENRRRISVKVGDVVSVIDGPYAFINAGWKDDIEVKWYPRYQEVVNDLKKLYPRLTIIQVGSKDYHPRSAKINHPPLEGVVDMRGRWDTDAWEFILAANQAEFGIGPTSFIKHVFSGLGRPYVCVIPGDEPLSWTWSPGVKYITRYGQLPCCQFGACYKHTWAKCTDMRGERLPACMDIPPDEIVAGVQEFVRSGLANPWKASITVGMLYDKGLEKMGRQTSAAMVRYAKAHKYGWLLRTETLDETRAPSWSKIPLILQYLKDNPGCEWFFWLDADALIMNYNVKLETLVDPDKDFVIGDDKPGHPNPWPLANAGVFLIRNCPASLRFLQSVWDRKNMPDYEDGNWEQMAVREMMVKTPDLRWKIIPRRRFNSFQAEYKDGDFIQHFTGDLPSFKDPVVDRVTFTPAPILPPLPEKSQGVVVRGIHGPRASLSVPCLHLGPLTGAEHACKTCGGHIVVKEFSCGVHGVCVRGKPQPGIQGCMGCQSYAPVQ